jgi:hypothetical protein
MPKKRTSSTTIAPEQWFVKELAGEVPPSFSAMDRLYQLASTLFQLRPWQLLDESNLVMLRDSASGEICYCSVMGALGQVYAMHAYIGTESFRLFRKMEAREVADAGEFFATQRSVYVEFVPRKELEKQDRELLVVLGHPQGRGLAAPIFRAIRPGFHPWFVTHDEARTLAECIRAMVVVCSAVAEQKGAQFWEQADTYPMVSRAEEDEPQYRIDLVKSILPAEPPLAHIQVEEETLRQIRSQDYAVRGVMELDHVLSGAAIGKKSERKACAGIALAVDAHSGIVHAPEVTGASVAAGEAMAKAFLNAIQANRALPKEIRVRSRRFKDCLAPLAGYFGVTIKITSQLPALDQAKIQLLRFFDEGLDGR